MVLISYLAHSATLLCHKNSQNIELNRGWLVRKPDWVTQRQNNEWWIGVIDSTIIKLIEGYIHDTSLNFGLLSIIELDPVSESTIGTRGWEVGESSEFALNWPGCALIYVLTDLNSILCTGKYYNIDSARLHYARYTELWRRV